MFHSIRWRLVLSYTLLTLLTVTLLGVLVLSLMQRYIEQQETKTLQENAAALARQSQQLLRWPLPGRRLDDLAQSAAFLGNFRVKIFDEERQVLVDSGIPDQMGEVTWFAAAPAVPLGFPADDVIFFASAEPIDTLLQTGAVQTAIYTQVVDSPDYAVTVIRQSPGLWGARLDFSTLAESAALSADSLRMTNTVTNTAGVFDVAPGWAGAERIDKHQIEAFARVEAVHRPQSEQSARSNRLVTTPIEANGGVVGYVELSDAPSFGAETLAAIRRLFVYAAGGVSLLAVIVGLLISRGLTAPIQALTEAAGRMNAGDLSVRAPIESSDEIGGLARAFNQMAAALERSFAALAAERDALRRFVADASHELRTPITALRTFNELLQGAADEDRNARHEFLDEGKAQIDRLERITSNLLNLSRLEGGLVELKLEEHDLGELLMMVGASFKLLAQEKGVGLKIEPPSEPIRVHCDATQLESALGNLIENALKFTTEGGQVQVGGERSAAGDQVMIWVKDNGAGIEAEELTLIFDRFHRGPNASAGGSGLGLAIVKSIVEAHGGTVEVVSQVGVGSRFVVKLPRSEG